jgi:hypothetical protein
VGQEPSLEGPWHQNAGWIDDGIGERHSAETGPTADGWVPADWAATIIRACLSCPARRQQLYSESSIPGLQARVQRADDPNDPLPEAPPALAWLLGNAMWGPESLVFQLVVHLLLHALHGSRIAHVAGPVGAGKSTTIVAFAGVLFLVSHACAAIFCQANLPLDGTAELAYRTIQPIGTVRRACSANYLTKAEVNEGWRDELFLSLPDLVYYTAFHR